MIEQIADRIAISLKKADPHHAASIEVLKFSLIIMLQGMLIVMVSLGIGWITEEFFATILTIIAFVVLRMVSGGIHLNSSLACTVVSVALMTILPHIHLNEEWNRLLMYGAVAITFLFAPSNIEGHSRIDKKYYPVLKLLSVGLISVNFIVLSPTITLAFFVQSVSLLPLRRKNS